MKLVDDARHWWRWASLRLIAVCAALQGASLAFPDTLRQYIPDRVMHAVAISILAGAFLGRLVKQGDPGDKT